MFFTSFVWQEIRSQLSKMPIGRTLRRHGSIIYAFDGGSGSSGFRRYRGMAHGVDYGRSVSIDESTSFPLTKMSQSRSWAAFSENSPLL